MRELQHLIMSTKDILSLVYEILGYVNTRHHSLFHIILSN
jgi:hypothetical protein